MEYRLIDFLSLIGSLGVFLYGMKIMSEALQKAAGDKMRQIMSAMTSNRFKGVLTGLLITTAIQSSSATTIMVVSFVNAGLLSLIESIGVIMGANIGTTVTAWIISILGFKLKISVLSLPMIGFGVPFLFSKNKKRRNFGEFVTGFALLFLGLSFMIESVPDIRSNPEILSFLSNYSGRGFFSIILFLIIGTVLTVVVQSSSATMALTLVMCNNGWISFDIAAAMVLGENIGTTITANLAAMIGNVSSKRAARAHFLFNVIGVIWILFVFRFFLRTIDHFMIGAGFESPFLSTSSMPIALSIFHTSFNLLNVLFLVGFARIIEKIVIVMVPQKDHDEEEFRLKYINFGLLSTAELSILQAKNEIIVYSKRVRKMFSFVKDYFNSTSTKENAQLEERITKYEKISDSIEVEIALYLTKILENGDIGGLSSKRVKAMYKMIDDLESVADSCYNLMRTISRKRQSNTYFNPEQRKNINQVFELVDQILDTMIENVELGYQHVTLNRALELEEKINSLRDNLKIEHLKSIEANVYSYSSGIVYNDLFSESEKLADYALNVSESVYEILH